MSDTKKPLPIPVMPRLLNAAEIQEVEMRWLWWPYFPIGVASMIFGAGGIGKSHIACEIASKVTTGEPLPGQNPEKLRVPQNVLMLSAEDDPASVMVPRLRKAGADLSRVFIPEEPFTLTPAYIRGMESYMQKAAATIVFIDPMVAFIGGKVDMNKMNQVREITGALAQAARHAAGAIIMIHHSRKGGEGETYEKAAGSADFVNSVRSVLFARKAPDGTRVLQHVKTNYAKEGPSLAYEFDDDHFHWIGEFDDKKLLAQTGGGAAVGQARAFIMATLKDGPVPAVEVIAFATEEGVGKSALERAKVGLAESFLKNDHGQKQWFWRLL